MKALTLMNPWGYAHTHLGKRVENRTWLIPKDRYALHSGKRVDKKGAEYIESLGIRIDWDLVVTSAVIAVCDIVRVAQIDREFEGAPQLELCLDPNAKQGHVPAAMIGIPEEQHKWTFGPYAHFYDLKTFRVLPKPVPCSGKQGLWELPAPVWQAVREQLLWMPPVVLNRHIHGKPQGSVYVGRPTKWGNPFSHQPDDHTYLPQATRTATTFVPKEEVLQRYEDWLRDRRQAHLIADAKRELRGRDLVCSCAPKPCHADILLREANA